MNAVCFNTWCPNCHRQLRAPVNFLGALVQCPVCGGLFLAQQDERSHHSLRFANKRPLNRNRPTDLGRTLTAREIHASPT